MKTPLTLLLSLTFLFLFGGSSVLFADDLQDGLDAASKGDYKAAYKLLLPLAEQGDAKAQYNLGWMYKGGLGLPQDYQETFKWWRLAAQQGHASAKFNVGSMYYKGLGVPQDYVLAHMWLNLASSQGHVNARTNKNIVESKMTPSQIEEAQRMARNWKPKK
jgi:uncharacterized protein